MVIRDLERPLEWQKLSDWACTQFIDIKQENPNLKEKEIVQTIFNTEYQKDYIPLDMKELAKINVNSIESIPDLLFTMLNMEAEGGRDKERLDTIFLSAIIYCIKTYQDKLPGKTQLNTIGIISGLILKQVDLKFSDPEKRSEIKSLLGKMLICEGMYKTYKTNEEAFDAITYILKNVGD